MLPKAPRVVWGSLGGDRNSSSQFQYAFLSLRGWQLRASAKGRLIVVTTFLFYRESNFKDGYESKTLVANEENHVWVATAAGDARVGQWDCVSTLRFDT